MLSLLRSFLVVLDEGSLHRASARLNISQSALSRQMQALEHEFGGRLLERSTTGIRPTKGGLALAEKMRGFLAEYDDAVIAVRRILRGEEEQLRIGYLASAFKEYLDPAIKAVKRAHPKTKVKLLDLFPSDQIAALRRGEIDVAMVQLVGDLLGREFYSRRLAVVGSVAAVSETHRLANRRRIAVADLAGETLLCGSEELVPGNRGHIVQICRQCGKFRPKLLAGKGELSDGLSLVANDDAVALLPAFTKHLRPPGVVLIPVSDKEATWDITMIWQRGRLSDPLRVLLDSLPFQGIPAGA